MDAYEMTVFDVIDILEERWGVLADQQQELVDTNPDDPVADDIQEQMDKYDAAVSAIKSAADLAGATH